MYFVFLAYPDVEIHDIDESWEFILLASDGIWDVMSNDDIVRLCLRKIEMGIPPETICEEIMTECLSPDLLMTGTGNIILIPPPHTNWYLIIHIVPQFTDNMTIILAVFLHNQPYENIIKRAKEINQREQLKADEIHNALNDSYPATSADTSETSPYNIRRSGNDFEDDDDDEDGDKIDSDDENGHHIDGDAAGASETNDLPHNQRQSEQVGGNGALVANTTEQTNVLNGELTPKSPKNQSDVKDDDDMVQECKKHKENDFEEDR